MSVIDVETAAEISAVASPLRQWDKTTAIQKYNLLLHCYLQDTGKFKIGMPIVLWGCKIYE